MTAMPEHDRTDARARFVLIGHVLRGAASGAARALTTWLLERLHP